MHEAWSVELQEDFAFRLIFDGLASGLDELFHWEDPPYSLLEDVAVLYYVPLGLFRSLFPYGGQICIEPKSSDGFVFEV